ncbi:hypothetical protein B0W47_05580 [Komagataeibacter nataicola]|uniref:Uncharacterized protein n=2 Tax=Komagataeibacter TaxID=1434011 RepID=A0A9N7CKQ6_9PROT|nr:MULTISPECIES: hypothetical protein [Komagataeibacter]AQU87038.1 hypothetical protein B0W47_05580 [Komagataeibacter nataicola]MBV0889217.1 hypothetical protein [Komagataeibacter oboediens]MBV1830217.1 hypothetical protein [Komagataeibacter melomenusus]MCK9821209.1 hypothetical protein [Komagataeibacter oboediens]NPC65693.1 hypothetical protein [Komagataeibacter melomenusus]
MAKKPVPPIEPDDWDDDGAGFLQPLKPPPPVRDPADLRLHTRQLADFLRARFPDRWVGVEIGTLPLRCEDDLFSDFIDLGDGLGVRLDYDPEEPERVLWISAGNRDLGGEPLDFPRDSEDCRGRMLSTAEIAELLDFLDREAAY